MEYENWARRIRGYEWIEKGESFYVPQAIEQVGCVPALCGASFTRLPALSDVREGSDMNGFNEWRPGARGRVVQMQSSPNSASLIIAWQRPVGVMRR
jgi:hypothetical protein